jgi:hypothetical protein
MAMAQPPIRDAVGGIHQRQRRVEIAAVARVGLQPVQRLPVLGRDPLQRADAMHILQPGIGIGRDLIGHGACSG